MSETIRVITMICTCFSTGVLIALYFRLGRLVLPQGAMSLLVVSSIAINLGIAYRSLLVLHKPYAWSSVPAFLGIIGQLVSLVLLYIWYGTPSGREHMRRMQAGRKTGMWNRE